MGYTLWTCLAASNIGDSWKISEPARYFPSSHVWVHQGVTRGWASTQAQGTESLEMFTPTVHQKKSVASPWMVETLWIMGCLPPINRCRVFFHPPYQSELQLEWKFNWALPWLNRGTAKNNDETKHIWFIYGSYMVNIYMVNDGQFIYNVNILLIYG